MSRAALTAFVDALFVVVLILVLLPHQEATDGDVVVQSQLAVEIRWGDHLATDVDLWVWAPTDSPVGYTNKQGAIFALTRDDIGVSPAPWRHEISSSELTPDGEYVINLHLYSNKQKSLPVRVKVFIWHKPATGSITTLWSGNVVLRAVGQEITAVRFKMKKNYLVAGSVHHTPELFVTGLK